jgi:hypothetical protein
MKYIVIVNEWFTNPKYYSEDDYKEFTGKTFDDIILYNKDTMKPLDYFYKATIGTFFNSISAKIYVAQKRIEYLENKISKSLTNYNNYREYAKEMSKTKKWLEEKKKKYPEYFV